MTLKSPTHFFFSPMTWYSGVSRRTWVTLPSTATLLVSFLGFLCDYRQFLIWWRLCSFVMIIAEFWPVIGCKRSMTSDSPLCCMGRPNSFFSAKWGFPSIHPSILSIQPSCSLHLSLLSQFINLVVYISFSLQSVLTWSLSFRYWKLQAVESQLSINDLLRSFTCSFEWIWPPTLWGFI